MINNDLLIKLYVATFGRACDADGLAYWDGSAPVHTDLTNIEDIAAAMTESYEFQSKYAGLSREEAVKKMYMNLFNRDADPAGLDYWVNGEGANVPFNKLLLALIEGAKDDANGQDKTIMENKAAVGKAFAEAGLNNIQLAEEVMQGITADPASIESKLKMQALTAGTDNATAGVFEAPMVYTPDGSDRILSLQDEDHLTGIGNNALLHVEMGQVNADEGTSAVVTPTLVNVAKVEADFTGSTNTLDLRNAQGLKELEVAKVTAAAGAANFTNIQDKVDTLSVANIYDAATTVNFTYVNGVLAGNDDSVDLSLDNINATSVSISSVNKTEGFENVNLNVANGVSLQGAFATGNSSPAVPGLGVAEMENLKITGDGNLTILTQAWTANEYNLFSGTALANPGSIGLKTLDLSGFNGDSNIDITLALGAKADPANSGQIFHTVTTGGKGDDTFYANAAVTATSATNRDVIDGGEGDNTFVTYNGNIAGNAQIKNIQTLELRDQDGVAGFGTVDFDAFDTNLEKVLMRDEDKTGTATNFVLNNLTSNLAENALQLNHSITTAGNVTVTANLKDASGANDTVALTVVNDLNKTTTFNYTLTAGGTTAATQVENVTVHDNDTESNTLTLTNANQHTGTVTLDGGSAGQTYTVANVLRASTVDASAQASDLRLQVGDSSATTTIAQDVKLGTGNDVLVYNEIDELDSADKLSDAGGNDTVRAAFSKDSSLDISGIEALEVTATANVKLNMANADVDKLIIMSNTATDGSGDISNDGMVESNYAGAGLSTNVITLDGAKIDTINFSADNDTDDVTNVGDAVVDDNARTHTFNGVTLLNNTATDITVNIDSSLDAVDVGSLSYTVGQITSHNNKTMNIVVSDEDTETTVDAATTRSAGNGTTINNIFAKNMETLTAEAWGNLNLGTVSGNALNNSLKTFDMSKVGGDVTANIISLGDNAVVKLADGDNTINALGSAGNNVTFTAGNGNNTITGTAQSDKVTTGSGDDAINADRGDNIIKSGAGNDIVTAKDGSDTVDLGTGIDEYYDNLGTGIDGSLATNAVAMSGGVASIRIDVTGDDNAGTDGIFGTADDIVAGTDIQQMLAVGEGSDLYISWTGSTIANAVLDGNNAQQFAADGSAGTNAAMTSGSDLVILSTGGTETITASAGNDVVMFTASAAGDGLDFSGGAGNDAAVGTIDNDIFNGGAGADNIVLQDLPIPDGNSDTVVINDGDSTATAYDKIAGFDFSSGTGGTANAAVGSSTAGDDVLDLTSTVIANAADSQALTTNITTADGTIVDDIQVNADGLVTFHDNTSASNVVMVGTANNEVSLEDALSALATELNNTTKTVAFLYDENGDGNADHTFVFQDGANDTVVELIGLTTTAGLEAVGGGTANLIEIA